MEGLPTTQEPYMRAPRRRDAISKDLSQLRRTRAAYDRYEIREP